MPAMLALALAWLGLLGSPAASAQASADDSPPPRVTIALLPYGTTVEQIADAVPGIAPGVMSAGIGGPTASQTYLDIGQGARISNSLYPDEDLPPLYVTGNRVSERRWDEVLDRADAAPADLVPGLLASTLEKAGISVSATPLAGSPALIAADREGMVRRGADCVLGECPGVTVGSVPLADLPGVAARLRPQDYLFAIERPPPVRDLLAIGIAGPGFTGEGNLSSPTTRMPGYVASTDLLPTILDAYEVDIPDEVTGRVIETDGEEPDAASVTALEERLGAVPDRRTGALAVNLLIWLAALALATLIWRRRGAVIGLRLLAIAFAAVPAIVLIPAAITPSEPVERLIIGLGAPLAAALALAATRRFGANGPYAAFALVAAVSVTADAIDVIAGSPLTALSMLGSNPVYGVRFFGIGNELEATIAVLLMLGTGAAVTALTPRDRGRTMAIAVIAVTLAAVLVFAPGRFGADVGAAITFPAGAAAAVIAALGLAGRRALFVVLAPAAALALLVGVDLLLGGDAHLSRSVLDAGGLDELSDVFERRITLGAESFPRMIDSPFFIASLVAIAVMVWQRRRIASWLEGRPAVRAGMIGAAGATVIGTLANDSAALLLMVGTGFIAAFCGLAWGAAPPADEDAPR
jgi:hypothetical protein